ETAPAFIAATPTRPDPAAKSSTRLPAASSGWSRSHRARPCPPAQAKAQNGGGRPIPPNSSSVSRHSGVTSSASHSEISGACGTGWSRVLARMKAVGSGMGIDPALQGVVAAPILIVAAGPAPGLQEAEAAQFGDRGGGGDVGNEHPALLLPEVAELDGVVDEGVAGVAVFALQRRGGGDHLDAGEVARRPAPFLGFGPGPSRQAGQDDRIAMADGLVELHGVGHQLEGVEEVRCRRDAAPEGLQAEPLLEPARRHAEHRLGALGEVGKDAIAVEIDAGLRPGLFGHSGQRRRGFEASGPASAGPWLRSRSSPDADLDSGSTIDLSFGPDRFPTRGAERSSPWEPPHQPASLAVFNTWT